MYGCAAPLPCGRLARAKCSNRPGGKKFRSTMNMHFHHRFFPNTRRAARLPLLALLFSGVRLAPPVFAANAKEPAPIEHPQPSEPGSQHASAVRTGALSTRDGLTLRLTTDFGPVNIVQLEAGAAPVVRYNVHIETDARGPAAQQLLDSYSLKAKSTAAGVEITGTLPPQATRSADAQFWVQFEIAVPPMSPVVMSPASVARRLFTRKAETSRRGASALQESGTPRGDALPPKWRPKADTFRFSMSQVTSRPLPEAATSTWATSREMLRCVPGAATSAQARLEAALNWRPPAATSPSPTPGVSSA